MSLVTPGVKAKCLLKALVNGVQYRGIVKVNLEKQKLWLFFENEEAKHKVDCF